MLSDHQRSLAASQHLRLGKRTLQYFSSLNIHWSSILEHQVYMEAPCFKVNLSWRLWQLARERAQLFKLTLRSGSVIFGYVLNYNALYIRWVQLIIPQFQGFCFGCCSPPYWWLTLSLACFRT